MSGFQDLTPEQREYAAASIADEKLFRGWAERIRAGLPPLPGDETDEDSPRMALINEIHAEVARRHPLGIAEELYAAISCLHSDADLDALEILDLLVKNERESRQSDDGPEPRDDSAGPLEGEAAELGGEA